MTDETKTTFEFDPLPGDQAAQPAPAEEVQRPKRGRPAKADKVERKKRGPRRVPASERNPAAEARVAPDHPVKLTAELTATTAKDLPWPRVPLNEYDFLRLLIDLAPSSRKTVLDLIKKVFG